MTTRLLTLKGVTLVQQHSHFPVNQSERAPHTHTAGSNRRSGVFLPHAIPGNQEVLPNLSRLHVNLKYKSFDTRDIHPE